MKKEIVIPNEIITNKIYLIRNQKVMLDKDLALLLWCRDEKVKRTSQKEYKSFSKLFYV